MDQEASFPIGASTFRVGYADLTSLTCDVLVSSDDNLLSMGGGVSRALKHAGGEALVQHARKMTPLRQGDVVATTAGDLSARYVLHAVTIEFAPRRAVPDGPCIQQLVERSIDLAVALGARSIAYPALGTGSGGFAFAEGAEAMVRTISDRLEKGSPLETVDLALHARRGVPVELLGEFYRRAVALVSVSGQNRRLAAAVHALEQALEETSQGTLKQEVSVVLARVRNAETVLDQHLTDVDTIERLEHTSGVTAAVRDTVRVSETVAATADNRSVEAQAYETRLEGLNTQLTVHYSSLNKLELAKAKRGSLDVSITLENQIDDVKKDVSAVEAQIREVRGQLAAVTADPLTGA